MTETASDIESPPCPLCGEPERRVLYDAAPLAVAECVRCRHVYTAPRLRAAARKRLYDEGYVSAEAEADVLLPGYADNEKVFLDDARTRLQTIARYAVRPGRVLDVGAGGGFFLAAAREEGWDVAGTDLSDAMIAHCNKTFGIRLGRGDFARMHFAPGLYDLVTLWHVLEHVEDVRTVLARAHKALARRGLLAVAVPDIGSTNARRYGGRWVNLQPQVHLHHFRERVLNRLLCETGFVPLCVTRQGGTGICAARRGSGRLRAFINRHMDWLAALRRLTAFANTRLLRRYDFITVYARRRD